MDIHPANQPGPKQRARKCFQHQSFHFFFILSTKWRAFWVLATISRWFSHSLKNQNADTHLIIIIMASLLCSALLCYLSNCISCLIGSSAGLLPCSAAFPATFSNGSGDSHLSNVGCAALQEVELVAKNSFKWRSFPLRISLYGVNSCQPLDYLECS